MSKTGGNPRGSFFVIATACLAGIHCGSVGIYLDLVADDCAAGQGDDCWQLGEMHLHKTAATHYSGWDRPLDPEQARAAYERGCKLHSVQACAALLERHLLDDRPAERDAMLAHL